MGEWIFFSFILGIGLAADAFSVSVADAFSHPEMGRPKRLLTAGVFGGFQMAMPLIGWLLVRTAEDVFSALERAVPWIAMIILTVLGTRMIAESLRGDADPEADGGSLLWQGLATSIDALSAGLTMSSFDAGRAFATSLIIGAFIDILGGTLIIENIFGIPGIGNLYVTSINLRDYNFFMALNIFYTLIGLTSGIVIDISYGFIDPRIRMGSKK